MTAHRVVGRKIDRRHLSLESCFTVITGLLLPLQVPLKQGISFSGVRFVCNRVKI